MPLWFFPALIGLGAIVTLVSGTWLALHLTAVTRLYANRADIVPAPVRPRASKNAVRMWLAAFALGTVISLAVPLMILAGAVA